MKRDLFHGQASQPAFLSQMHRPWHFGGAIADLILWITQRVSLANGSHVPILLRSPPGPGGERIVFQFSA